MKTRTPHCIVCATELASFLQCKQGTVLRCRQCGLGVLKDIPQKTKVFKYYNTFYDERQSERFHPLFELAIRFFRQLRVRVVESFAQKKGKILDVGFGRPLDLEIFQHRGWEAYGTQIVPHTVHVAQQHGLKAFLGELPDAQYHARSFDVVTIWHVLEHLHEPGTYLKEAHRILKPNGKLIIEVPNISSPIARWFGCNWLGLDLPHHLYHFTPAALSRFLRQHGFSVIKTKFFSLEQSPFAALQSMINALTGQRNVVFESIKTQGAKIPAWVKAFHALLAVALAPFALLLSVLLGLAGKGDIMRFYCVKREGHKI